MEVRACREIHVKWNPEIAPDGDWMGCVLVMVCCDDKPHVRWQPDAARIDVLLLDLRSTLREVQSACVQIIQTPLDLDETCVRIQIQIQSHVDVTQLPVL